MPTRSESALFAEQTYEMVKEGGKGKRIKTINKNIESTGYKVDRKHSNRNVVTYVNDKTGSVHVSHRGTDTSGKRTMKDLEADFKIAIGKTKNDKQFKKRTADTEKALEAHHDKKASGSAHSLGGKSITTSMATNKTIRRRMDNVDTFNAGATIFNEKEMHNLDKEGKTDMKNKMVHHRTANDPVSASMVVNKPYGTVKTYKEKNDKNPDKTRETSAGLGKVFKKGDVSGMLHSHSMEHFYNKKQYHDE